MIGGVQPKILVDLTSEGEFKIDEGFAKLFCEEVLVNWKLVRERDNLTKKSHDVIWLEFSDDRSFKAKHTDIKVGYSLLMSPFTAEFTWQTTEIVDFHVRGDGGWYFKTKNSNYILYKHEQI